MTCGGVDADDALPSPDPTPDLRPEGDEVAREDIEGAEALPDGAGVEAAVRVAAVGQGAHIVPLPQTTGLGQVTHTAETGHEEGREGGGKGRGGGKVRTCR